MTDEEQSSKFPADERNRFLSVAALLIGFGLAAKTLQSIVTAISAYEVLRADEGVALLLEILGFGLLSVGFLSAAVDLKSPHQGKSLRGPLITLILASVTLVLSQFVFLIDQIYASENAFEPFPISAFLNPVFKLLAWISAGIAAYFSMNFFASFFAHRPNRSEASPTFPALGMALVALAVHFLLIAFGGVYGLQSAVRSDPALDIKDLALAIAMLSTLVAVSGLVIAAISVSMRLENRVMAVKLFRTGVLVVAVGFALAVFRSSGDFASAIGVGLGLGDSLGALLSGLANALYALGIMGIWVAAMRRNG